MACYTLWRSSYTTFDARVRNICPSILLKSNLIWSYPVLPQSYCEYMGRVVTENYRLNLPLLPKNLMIKTEKLFKLVKTFELKALLLTKIPYFGYTSSPTIGSQVTLRT